MSVRKRGKSWLIDYFDSISGKRVRKAGFKTKPEANEALAQATVNNRKGLTNVVDKDITVKIACIDFLNNYAKCHCKQKTYDEYKRIINNEIIPHFNDKKLITLAKLDVELFQKYLKEERNLSNASVNKYITLIGSIIERQIENEKIFQNVAKKVKKLKLNKTESRALTKEEINILLNTCMAIKPEFYPMVYTVLNTGLRRGEAIALKWENIDFDKNTIHVTHSEYKGQLGSPKTNTSNRYINIPKGLRKILLELKLKSNGSEFVFPNAKGGMYTGNNIYRRFFVPVVKACNIGKFRFHDLRHTYCSHLLESHNVSDKYVQEQMGHSSFNMTMNTYAHYSQESQENAMKVLDNMCDFDIANF